MAEINLLQPEQVSASTLIGRGQYFVSRILMIILIVMLAGYAYLFVDLSRTNTNVAKTKSKIAQAQQEALNNKNRGELLTRQGQLKELDTLIKGHLYWSYLLPELARVTLKSAKYSNIEADATGKLNLTVSLNSYEELEKFLQIFDLPEYNEQFSNVKVISITKTQQEATGTIDTAVKLQLTFNPAYIKGKL
jgi:hypothetical protein